MRVAADGGSSFVPSSHPAHEPAPAPADAPVHDAAPVAKAAPSPPTARQQQVGDDAARQQLRNDLTSQHALIAQAEAKAQATADPKLKAAAGTLQSEYDALQKSKLAADVYHFDNIEGAKPRVGWTRASSLGASELAKYGLTPADLDPGQTASGFRAELYIPDKTVFGADAKPVLAFRGSTNDLRDWQANGKQGVGQQSDYYDRAMTTAANVARSTDGAFEITGHSLGGGLASAASAATGAPTTTFNASGLNVATATRFLASRGLKPADTANTVTAYQVKGEALTSLQESLQGLSPAGARALTQGIHGALGIARQPLVAAQLQKNGIDPGDFTFLQRATAQDLANVPLAAGHVVKLDAYGNDGNARPQVMPLGDVIAGLDVAARTAAPVLL